MRRSEVAGDTGSETHDPAANLVSGIPDLVRAATELSHLGREIAARIEARPTSPERVALGRFLFWNPVLSGNSDVARDLRPHHRVVDA